MTEERKFMTPNGAVAREGYVKYLRECAMRWRNAPVGIGVSAAKEKAENEEQARKVEEKAARIERGEE